MCASVGGMKDYSNAGILKGLALRLERRLGPPDAEGCRVWPPLSSAVIAPYISYSTARNMSRQITVRRAAWCVLNAVAPSNMPAGVTVTTCGKALCCTHVKLVTHAEQIAGAPKRRTRSALEPGVREAILAAAGSATQVALARRFGVSQRTVHRLCKAAT